MSLLAALLTLALTAATHALTLPSSVPFINLNNDTIPTNSTSPTNSTTLPDGTVTGITPLLGASYFCNKMRFGQKIKIRNCNTASVKLYSGHEIHHFHIGEPDNAFRLPQGAEEGDCNIDVSLNGENREPGSWVGIKLAVHELIVACADGSTTSTGTGHITTGPHNRIKVEIRRISSSVGGEEEGLDAEGGNGTMATTTGEGGIDGSDQGGVTPVGGYPLHPSIIAVT